MSPEEKIQASKDAIAMQRAQRNIRKREKQTEIRKKQEAEYQKRHGDPEIFRPFAPKKVIKS